MHEADGIPGPVALPLGHLSALISVPMDSLCSLVLSPHPFFLSDFLRKRKPYPFGGGPALPGNLMSTSTFPSTQSHASFFGADLAKQQIPPEVENHESLSGK